KATVTTSNDPNTPPSMNSTANTTRRSGNENGDGPPWTTAGAGAGSVVRWTRNSVQPTTRMTTVASIAVGGPWTIASQVTSGGPRTKIHSSRTDSSENAVRSAGVPDSAAAHRARTSAPTLGNVAPPMIATGKYV